MSQSNNPLRLLNTAGQSIWYDYIHRSFVECGALAHLIQKDDLRGITSNPTIFDKAITGSHDYDMSLRRLLSSAPSRGSREWFFALASEDIRAAADLLMPTYTATEGVDGMVSLEVSPHLAHDTQATLQEARLLHKRIGRPNVMIKVPATLAGLPAIETLIAEGINVNVTLLFSVTRYQQVAEAYLRGLEQRIHNGRPISRIASVASFFVSRLDSVLDPLLKTQFPELQGKIAIANAKAAYHCFKALFSGDRFALLADAGALPQRLLWASTSTKNPAYSDVYYVENLIAPQTVNTLPPATYEAFRDHGVVNQTLEQHVDTALAQLAALADLGIDLDTVTERLEAEGVAAFAQAFDNLLNHLDAKAMDLAASV
jgi:transaldolase/transaldolase/glucose-6-phosphate isomerase